MAYSIILKISTGYVHVYVLSQPFVIFRYLTDMY